MGEAAGYRAGYCPLKLLLLTIDGLGSDWWQQVVVTCACVRVPHVRAKWRRRTGMYPVRLEAA